MTGLDLFDPIVAAWFRERLGEPTAVQNEVWERVARGEHVLVAAETGSGKTLAAFLHAINALLTGATPGGGLRVAYVSPLKALGADVRENLAGPLLELRRRFQAAGRTVPPVRVMVRSGDTPQAERRAMLRHPPEILVTTPESLHLLLTSRGGRGMLGGVRLVILDEIHALAGNRRGTLLSVGVERLAQMSGEFQRVALSATARPEAVLARFVGGCRLSGGADEPVHEPRAVSVVRGVAAKPMQVVVRVPRRLGERTAGDFFEPFAAAWREMLFANRTTAFFIDSRRMCEKVAGLINAGADPPVVYPHHGSLSREVRQAVERRLKNGTLRGVTATGSLELGIDVGDLDAVALIQAPPSVSAAVQRVGRSGHRAGAVRRGVFFPLTELETALCGVMARAVVDGDIEDVAVVMRPLDVLAQVLLSMTAHEAVSADRLYARVRCAWPYHDLPRRQFDLVLDMLAGRFGQSRPRELAAKVFFDRVAGTVLARPGAALSIYASGGVIPDRGTYVARMTGAGDGASGGVVAELDEEFVFEARVGQVFGVGGQGWRIERITPAEVQVSRAADGAAPPPFWHGDARGWDAHFAALTGAFFQWAEARLDGGAGPDDAAFLAELEKTYLLEPHAAQVLAQGLAAQRRATRTALPHQGHILVERTATGPGGVPGRQIILHMPFGLRVNRTMAVVVEAAFAAKLGQEVRTHAANEGVAVLCPDDPQGLDAEGVLFLAAPGEVEGLLRTRLEGSQEFGAAFREAAWRSLVLGRGKIGRRMPLWITRLRSQKLLAAVRDLTDFPLVVEAWRTCLTERFDAPGLSRILQGLADGEIAWSLADTGLQSPFARDMVWRVVAGFMYAGDAASTGATTNVAADLVAEAAADASLRPVAPAGAAARLGELLRRTAPGYAPGSPEELLQHVVERLAVPLCEWRELGRAMARDHGLSLADMEAALSGRLARFAPPHGAPGAGPKTGELVAAVENLPRLEAAFRPDREGEAEEAALEATAEWLRFYGPVAPDFAVQSLGLDPERGREAIAALVRDGGLIMGRLVDGGGEADICDTANFERLLRLSRAMRAPQVPCVSLRRLTPFVAAVQGISPQGKGTRDLFERLRRLTCLGLGAGLWEKEVLPARLAGYEPGMLDTVLRRAGLVWRGDGPGRTLFFFAGDEDLLAADAGPAKTGEAGEALASDGLAALFPDPLAAYDFSALLRRSGLRPGELTKRLWEALWRGQVENDDFEALRHGLASDFTLPELADGGEAAAGPALPGGRGALPRSGRRRASRGRLASWRAALPQAGRWRRAEAASAPEDEVERLERARERARIVLERYGVVFRELLVRESGPFSWGELWRALRLLELSGEALSGRFFTEAAGVQFLSRRGLAVFRRLFGGEPAEAAPGGEVFWLNALDPAAPVLTGLTLPGEGAPTRPPRRAEGTHLVFRGGELVFASEGRGRELFIGPGPDDPGLGALFAPLVHLLARRVDPCKRLGVSRINGRSAAASPYLAALARFFSVTADHKGLSLHARV
jgi:ATP-dependent Lhr-like helicase